MVADDVASAKSASSAAVTQQQPTPPLPQQAHPVAHKHTTRPSMLYTFLSGSELEPVESATPRYIVSYRGLLNLCMIVLFLGNVRLVMSNIRKYGLLLDLPLLLNGFSFRDWPSVSTVLAMSLFVLVAYYLEHRALAQVHESLRNAKEHNGKPTASGMISFLQAANVLLLAALPIVVIIVSSETNPLANLATLMIMTCLFAKLWSYADVNKRLRHLYELKMIEAARKRSDDDSDKATAKPYHPTSPTEYPNNLTLGNIFYFAAAPTLCYETDFPRTEKIRWLFVFKRTVEFCIINFIIVFIAMQYMFPLLVNTMSPLAHADLVFLSERIMKMAVPNMIIWLLGFYAFFHCFLNITGELLRFGDRMFYLDWWNCTTVGDFWRKWNLPVKNWFYQHVYMPMLDQGYSRTTAQVVIFFVSAVFHELIVSAAFRTIQFWAFFGMLVQVVAVILSQPLKGKQIGNVFFWITIMLGQPMIVTFYFADYMSRL